jgi:uncharacterized protein
MGILLTFMFIWNMIGALVLIPSLSHFLLRNVSTERQCKTEGRRDARALSREHSTGA